MKTLTVNLGERSYNIYVGAEILDKASEFFNLKRKTFIVTDTGVPSEYSKKIASVAKEAKIYTLPAGEESKSFEMLEKILASMLEFDMSRGDCVVAVGGGVVGDIAGFAAASYMRGVDFYNVPTTLLSQVDSSIGGKVAINLGVTKNIVGAFHHPKAVLIDTSTLKTLPKRQVSAGLAEVVKMALTSDEKLFLRLEALEPGENLLSDIEEIIISALNIKRKIVEADEKESGIRKILNFGHTFGHGIEAASGLSTYYHGECVALGMIPLSSDNVRERLIPVLKKLSLPTVYSGNLDEALSFVIHDKKCRGGMVDAIFVDEVGTYKIDKISVSDFSSLVKKKLEKTASSEN